MKQSPPTSRTLSAKGEAARENLKQAVLRLLNKNAHSPLKIVDVTAEAGVATGLFYHYFKDLNSLLDELLQEFIERCETFEETEKGIEKGDWFGRIRAHYRFQIDLYADYPGLLRSIYAEKTWRERWRASVYRQTNELVELMPLIVKGAELTAEQREVIVFGLRGVGTDLLWEIYIDGNPRNIGQAMSRDELAEWFAAVFYRGLFGCNPPAERLQYATTITGFIRRQDP